MSNDDLIKKLLDIHEKRKQNDPLLQGAKYYRFKEPGEKFVGRITAKTRDRFDRERFIAVDLKTNEEYVLPGHKALLSQLGIQNAEPGDYVVIEYLGQSEKGYHRYEVTVIDENEFKELQELESRAEEVQKEVEEVLKEEEKKEEEEELELDLEFEDEDKTLSEILDEKKEEKKTSNEESKREEEQKEETKVEEKKEEVKTDQSIVEEAKKCLDSLFAFYDKLPYSEVEYYLKTVKKFDVDVKELLEKLGYVVVDNQVIKKE